MLIVLTDVCMPTGTLYVKFYGDHNTKADSIDY